MAVIPKLRRRNRDGTMTLVEHLAELRMRIIVSFVAIGVGTVAGWFLFQPVFDLLTNPYCGFIKHYPQLSFNPSHPCALAVGSILDPFSLKLRLATFIGLAIALPVVLFELWRFVVPGLTRRERRAAVPFVVSSIVLFALGAWFAMLTLPKGLAFLLGFAGSTHIVAVLSVTKYLGFVVLLIAVFGLSFEFPLVLISLVAVGVLSSQRLRAWRRYAIVGIAIFAAVITPSQDWFTMTAMMVPLLVFYELAILVSRFVLKK